MHEMKMTDNTPIRQCDLPLLMLDEVFPGIAKIELDSSILASPLIKKLINLIKFSIPLHTFSADLLQLYDSINQSYYDSLLQTKVDTVRKSTTIRQQNEQPAEELRLTGDVEPIASTNVSEKKPLRSRINYLQLSRFIDSFTPDMEIHVNPETIREGKDFSCWQMKTLSVNQPSRQTYKAKPKNETYELKLERERMKSPQAKTDCVNITLGKNISLEAKIMKNYLIERAKNNKLLNNTDILTEMEKVQIEINFILNRLTEEYFVEFIEDLKPYAAHGLYSYILAEKVIEKIMEEHNFISLYARLVKSLKRVGTTDSFRKTFVVRLQERFYKLIRLGDWCDREELYKKQLIGMSMFVGELINCKFMSKFVFPDCFYELINSYILQYHKNQNNRQFYYFEIYVECIIKMMERMGAKYDSLLARRGQVPLKTIVDELLDLNKGEDYNFDCICDYLEVLKEINSRLPSQRFKITFLLEDFRCTKIIKKNDSDPNNEADFVKNILGMDHSQTQNASKIPEMISHCDALLLMKDFYFQFAEGNIKQVHKNIETFKLMLHCPQVCEAAIDSLRANLEGLFVIQSDFPFLGEAIAKVLKLVCDKKQLDWLELKLQHEDEDVNDFVESIEDKYFKLMVED